MKNLSSARRKYRLLTAAAIGCFLLSVIVPKILSAAFYDAWEQNATLFAVVTVLLFWIPGIVLFYKTFKKLIICDVMTKNGAMLRTDRRAFPSSDGTFDTDAIRAAFASDGFTVRDTDYGFDAVREGECRLVFFIVEQGKESAFTACDPAITKTKSAYVTVRLTDTVTDEEREEAKNVGGGAGTAIMKVFCDTSSGLAYYTGCDTDKNSTESYAQTAILHNILRRDSLPPKTDEDKTDDEKEWEASDIETVFYRFTHPIEEEQREAETLGDGELRLVRNGKNGMIFYRSGTTVISHPFRVEPDGSWTIPDPAFAYSCLPKVRRAKNDEIRLLKDALDRRLADDGVLFRYE